MIRQVGKPQFDRNGILQKGVIVRHLILPGHIDDSKRILHYLYHTYHDSIFISIMNQYTVTRLLPYPELNRSVSEKEYEEVIQYAIQLGIENAFIQEQGTDQASFISKKNPTTSSCATSLSRVPGHTTWTVTTTSPSMAPRTFGWTIATSKTAWTATSTARAHRTTWPSLGACSNTRFLRKQEVQEVPLTTASPTCGVPAMKPQRTEAICAPLSSSAIGTTARAACRVCASAKWTSPTATTRQ